MGDFMNRFLQDVVELEVLLNVAAFEVNLKLQELVIGLGAWCEHVRAERLAKVLVFLVNCH